jgi:hypothetical protein
MTMVATRSIHVSRSDRIDSDTNTPGAAFNKVIVTLLKSKTDLKWYKLLSLGTETALI